MKEEKQIYIDILKKELEIICAKIEKLDKSFLYQYSENSKFNKEKFLKENHYKKAEEIINQNIIKKNCNKCYGRGYLGWFSNNEFIVCKKCVDVLKVYNQWYEYLLSMSVEVIVK